MVKSMACPKIKKFSFFKKMPLKPEFHHQAATSHLKHFWDYGLDTAKALRHMLNFNRVCKSF